MATIAPFVGAWKGLQKGQRRAGDALGAQRPRRRGDVAPRGFANSREDSSCLARATAKSSKSKDSASTESVQGVPKRHHPGRGRRAADAAFVVANFATVDQDAPQHTYRTTCGRSARQAGRSVATATGLTDRAAGFLLRPACQDRQDIPNTGQRSRRVQAVVASQALPRPATPAQVRRSATEIAPRAVEHSCRSSPRIPADCAAGSPPLQGWKGKPTTNTSGGWCTRGAKKCT